MQAEGPVVLECACLHGGDHRPFLLVTCTVLCGTLYNVTSQTTQELARNVAVARTKSCNCMLGCPI